jgi:hypothetical protein
LQRALRALRQDKSLTAAAKAAHVSPERLKRVAVSKGAITKDRRRWVVNPRLPRGVRLFSRGRAIEIIMSRESASLAGAYMNAIGKFVSSPDPALLAPFVGQSVTDVSGQSHPLETNPNVLYRLLHASGETFESIYRIVV